MTTLEVEPKRFPTSITSTISYNRTSAGFRSTLPSQTDDSSLGGDGASLASAFSSSVAQDGVRRKPETVSTQDKYMGQSSRILATRRGLSSNSPKRTPQRRSERSQFAKFDTISSQPAFETKDFNSREPGPESIFNFNTGSAPDRHAEDISTKFTPAEWAGKFEARDYFTPSRVRRDRVESPNAQSRYPGTIGAIKPPSPISFPKSYVQTAPPALSRAHWFQAADQVKTRDRSRKQESISKYKKVIDSGYLSESEDGYDQPPPWSSRNPHRRELGRINPNQVPDSPSNGMPIPAQTFGNMGWKMRKGNAMSQISSTISKDNTCGDTVRNAKILADFGKKHQPFAFGSREQASENSGDESDTRERSGDHFRSERGRPIIVDERPLHRSRISSGLSASSRGSDEVVVIEEHTPRRRRSPSRGGDESDASRHRTVDPLAYGGTFRGSRAQQGGQTAHRSNRDFIRNLEDRTLEEGFMGQSQWQ
jgi:hypothetical protein